MMNRFWRGITGYGVIGLMAFIMAPASLAAQEANPGSQVSTRSCCLWKIQSPRNTVFLLGSIHMLKQEDYPLPERIYRAFGEAEHVVFEINQDTMNQTQNQLKMLKLGLYTNGKTLQSQMSSDGYAVAKTQLKERGYPIEGFKTFKPWFLALSVTALEIHKLGFDPNFGVDKHLFEKAKQQGKTVGGLETFEDQLMLFDHLSDDVQELFVLQSLMDLGLVESEMETILRAWKDGQAEGMQVTLTSMEEFPELYQSLIIERNNNWLPQIESFINQPRDVLVVVGTLHLLGEKGLLAVLKKKGYVVKIM